MPGPRSKLLVFVGCGTSFNLALSLAAYSNMAGRKAIAVPVPNGKTAPRSFWPEWRNTHVVALSRSGETTETVAAAKASRAAGAFVTAITVEPESSLAKNCDRMVSAETHPDEGIVMTVSASLMVLLGLADDRAGGSFLRVGSARRLAALSMPRFPASSQTVRTSCFSVEVRCSASPWKARSSSWK
jgi:glucosamine--fructose-6-phosphate aminotransferase (isomerizing)